LFYRNRGLAQLAFSILVLAKCEIQRSTVFAQLAQTFSKNLDDGWQIKSFGLLGNNTSAANRQTFGDKALLSPVGS
jgi:protein-tyrosine-phosphatase